MDKMPIMSVAAHTKKKSFEKLAAINNTWEGIWNSMSDRFVMRDEARG